MIDYDRLSAFAEAARASETVIMSSEQPGCDRSADVPPAPTPTPATTDAPLAPTSSAPPPDPAPGPSPIVEEVASVDSSSLHQPAETAPAAAAPSAAGTGPAARPPRSGVKPRIVAKHRLFSVVTEEAIAALVKANAPPILFARTGELVAVMEDEKGRMSLRPVGENAPRGRLARAANFIELKKIDGNFVEQDIPPPLDTVRDVASLGPKDWGFPAIEGLVEIPTLRPDGSVLDTAGYDARTSLFYAPSAGLKVPSIPLNPTPSEIAKAVAFIDESIYDFPFELGPDGDRQTAPSRANTFALFLTPVVRNAINGNVPIALIDAPQAGTGKSLLSDVIAMVTTGRSAPMLSPPKDEDEWRKAITSALLAGSTFIVYDNLDALLQSGALASVVTSRTWTDRILGKSQTAELPQRATWMVTGNNIRLGGDLPRRCYQIRLDAQVSRPWQRDGFRHPDLLGWLEENRGEFLAALLTLCRAWYAAGRPGGGVPSLGSFEGWSRSVSGILAVAGVKGFLGNVEALYEKADESGTQWQEFVRALAQTFGLAMWGAAKIVERLAAGGDLLQALPEELAVAYDGRTEKARSFQSKLGRALRRKVGVRYGQDEIRIELAPGTGPGGAAQYWVRWTGGPAPGVTP